MRAKTHLHRGVPTMPYKNIIMGLGMGLVFAACQTVPTDWKVKSGLPAPTSTPLCENDIAVIRADHKTARLNDCDVNPANRFVFTIRPEKRTDPQGEPINDSPWYGFRVDPKQAGAIRVSLNYENGRHRYQPKMSYDGVNWEVVPGSGKPEERSPKYDLRIVMDGRPFFISAQEVFTSAAHDAWTAKIAKRSDVTQSIIGQSRDGYPIKMLEVKTDANKKKPYVVWVGRQHPPEVTGALALLPFTEKVLDGSELSERFLNNFNLLVIPMMNPDGVKDGHWRFNKGGVDLNRDWGPFSQPETQAVKSAFQRFESGQDRIVFFLDFHSTWRNLFYTQADDEPATPPMFARDWLKAVDERLADNVYPFTREARHNSGSPISKNYMFDTYGISSITYEVGDHTPRSGIKISAKVFAEEMMKLLLKHETGT